MVSVVEHADLVAVVWGGLLVLIGAATVTRSVDDAPSRCLLPECHGRAVRTEARWSR